MRPEPTSHLDSFTTPRLLGLALVVSLLYAHGSAHADSEGLRISARGNGLSLSTLDGGLRLNLSLPGDNQTFGPMFAASVRDFADMQTSLGGVTTRGVLAADILQFGSVHSTVGLSWRQNRSIAADGLAARINALPPATAPYLSLGWRGDPRANSGWRLSAEVGAYFTMTNECGPKQSSCLKIPRSNSNKDPAAGISWNPYISFGASFLY